VKLAEDRAQHQRHARWRETKLQPDRGQRRSATASRMRPIFPATSSESTAQQFFDQEDAIVDRKIQGVCRGGANAGGAKGPDFWCTFEDGEVRVI